MHKVFSYWVPTTENIDFESCKCALGNTSLKKNVTISDIDDKVAIHLEIDPNSFDLVVTLLFDNNTTLDTINMTCIDSFESGIIIYKAESTSNDGVVQKISPNTEIVLKIQAYHLFKEFFHKHEYHSKKHDSLLEAYSSTEENDEDQILQHYAKLYIKKFPAYKRKLNLIPTSKIIKRFSNTKNLNALLSPAIKSITTAKNFIHQAMGEIIYAEFIIDSIPDKSERNNYKNELNKFKQQFEVQHKKYELTYEQIDMLYSKNINTLQIYLGIIGVVLGFGGIIFAVVSLFSSS